MEHNHGQIADSQPERAGTPTRILYGLIEPSAGIQGPERRRRARSLSLLLIVALVLELLSVSLTFLDTNLTSTAEGAMVLRVELGTFVLLAGVYAISRSRHFMPAASLTIGVFIVSTFSAAIYEPHTPATLAFVIIGGLVSSLFLSPRVTAMIFGLICIGLLALFYPLHRFSGSDIFLELILAFMVGIFVVVSTIVREQYLNQIEQQSHTLEANEERLIVALEATKETNSKLQESMKALEEYNREMTVLAELVNLLQACTTVEESYNTIGNIAPRLFPGFSGSVYAYGPSRDDLESVVQWGRMPENAGKRIFEPGKCWALRLTRPHRNDGLCKGIPCELAAGAGNSLCVPMIANGYTLGILYLLKNATADDKPEGQDVNEALAVMTSEHIALALANLKLQETLRYQSIRDPLTGLFNRRFMQESLLREIKRAERNKLPVGVIMADLDHFKEFNDAFGHEAGDMLLRRLGELLKTAIRASDIACRFGGEEFVIILPEASLENTRRRAEEIRGRIKQMMVNYHDQSLGTITSSFGVAVYPTHASSVEALLRVADRALYRAKAEGRDQVVTADMSVDNPTGEGRVNHEERHPETND
jgi:diguanylate cyclase (GGDEF)-like protein